MALHGYRSSLLCLALNDARNVDGSVTVSATQTLPGFCPALDNADVAFRTAARGTGARG